MCEAFKSLKLIFIKRTLLDTLNVVVINCFFVTFLSVKKNNGITVANASLVVNVMLLNYSKIFFDGFS